MLKAIGNAEEAQSSSQLLIVGVALLVEPFELDNASSSLSQLLGVMFGPLPDGGSEPEGGGVDGGVEGRIEGEDGLG